MHYPLILLLILMRGVKTACAAAVLADEYVLTHARGSQFGHTLMKGFYRETFRSSSSRFFFVAQESITVFVRHVPGKNGKF